MIPKPIMIVSRERQTQIHEPLTQASVILPCFVWDLLHITLETLSKLRGTMAKSGVIMMHSGEYPQNTCWIGCLSKSDSAA